MKLLENPLFAGISKQELDEMTHCFAMEQKQYREKEEIPVANRIGILLSGSVSLNRINADGTLDMLEFLTDGGIFGAFLSVVQDSGNFIIFCEKECTIIFIDAIHITKRCSRACRHHSLVVDNLLNLMTKKVQQLSEKVEILSHRSIREKLMCYFRMQSGKLETTTFTIPFSFSALANYICVDRSAMTRELRKMRNDGLLELNGRTVSLLTSI